MTRDTQPVSPRPLLPRLINQALAHIENNGTDHAATIRQHLGLALSNSDVTREDHRSAPAGSPMRLSMRHAAEFSRI